MEHETRHCEVVLPNNGTFECDPPTNLTSRMANSRDMKRPKNVLEEFLSRNDILLTSGWSARTVDQIDKTKQSSEWHWMQFETNTYAPLNAYRGLANNYILFFKSFSGEQCVDQLVCSLIGLKTESISFFKGSAKKFDCKVFFP